MLFFSFGPPLFAVSVDDSAVCLGLSWRRTPPRPWLAVEREERSPQLAGNPRTRMKAPLLRQRLERREQIGGLQLLHTVGAVRLAPRSRRSILAILEGGRLWLCT